MTNKQGERILFWPFLVFICFCSLAFTTNNLILQMHTDTDCIKITLSTNKTINNDKIYKN